MRIVARWEQGADRRGGLGRSGLRLGLSGLMAALAAALWMAPVRVSAQEGAGEKAKGNGAVAPAGEGRVGGEARGAEGELLALPRPLTSRGRITGKGERFHSPPGYGEAAQFQPHPWPYSTPWYPWYALPPSYPTKFYPPSITHVPRLGLQYNYPYALQMGFRVPDDSDPLDVAPNLGPYVGVVGIAKAEAERAERQSPRGLVALFKEKKYREAGQLLAAEYRESDDPSYPLLLAEVFFALGKHQHAEALLRQALESEGAVEALPDDVASHFASPDEFEAKLQDLASGGGHQLLLGYFEVHSRNPSAGIDRLQDLASKNQDKAAATLYRHYLGTAFK